MKLCADMTPQKKLLLLLSAALAGLSSFSPTRAESPASQWHGKFDSPWGEQKYQFDFKVTERKLIATAAAEMGDQQREVEFIDEKLESTPITFAERRKLQDNQMRIEYAGKVTDKGLAFTRRASEFGRAEFVASRVGPPPAPAAAAGPVPSPRNIPDQEFPKIHPNGHVTFRLKAPETKSVALNYGQPHPMERDAGGVWTITYGPIALGFHYDTFLVDGANGCDPAGGTFHGMSRMASGIELPTPGEDWWQTKDVPHGGVRERHYVSNATQNWQRIFIYAPLDYDADAAARYRVLHLQHGGVMADAKAFNDKVRLLYLSLGTDEGERFLTSVKGYRDSLESAGVKTVYFESPGTKHDWHTFRRSLPDFAPRLFKLLEKYHQSIPHSLPAA